MGARSRIFILGLGLAQVAVPHSAAAQEQVPVQNCQSGPASIQVVSPQPGQTYSRNIVHVAIEATCEGGTPILLKVDDVPYYPQDLSGEPSKLFVAHPEYVDETCCQTGGEGRMSFRLQVPVGDHMLTVLPGYMGTNLPRFAQIDIPFSTGGVALPFTGAASRLQLLGLVGMLLSSAGVWILKRSRCV